MCRLQWPWVTLKNDRGKSNFLADLRRCPYKATKFGEATHVEKRCVSSGLALPQPKGRVPPLPTFWGPPTTPTQYMTHSNQILHGTRWDESFTGSNTGHSSHCATSLERSACGRYLVDHSASFQATAQDWALLTKLLWCMIQLQLHMTTWTVWVTFVVTVYCGLVAI